MSEEPAATPKYVNIISAENDEIFHKFDSKNLILQTNPGTKTWVNIKYRYEKNNIETQLKLQTPNLFSSGITQFDDKAPFKLSLSLKSRKLHETKAAGNELSEEEKLTIQAELKTIKLIESIVQEIRNQLKKPEMVKEIGKHREKQWDYIVSSMDVLKRKDQENGIVESVNLYPKIMNNNNFIRTKFTKYINQNGHQSLKELDQEETIKKLVKKDTSCKVMALLVIDSIFIGKNPSIQFKVAEVLISKFITKKNNSSIILTDRLKMLAMEDSDDSDDEHLVDKKIIKTNDSDSDSD